MTVMVMCLNLLSQTSPLCRVDLKFHLDGSFVIPSLPPPVCSTPLSQNDVPEAASSEATEQSEEV